MEQLGTHRHGDRILGGDRQSCGECEIRDLTFCSVLTAEEMARVRACRTEVKLPAHHTIFHEADEADHLFNVTSGVVKLYKLLADGRRQITGFLFAGEFLGLAANRTYAYTAETVTEAKLCRFSRRRLEKLFDEWPHLEKHLLGIAASELIAAQDQMVLLGRKTAQEKMASFILMMSERAEARGQDGNPVTLPMNRADIGDYLGLTIETVSRTLTQLKNKGVISLMGSGHILLSKPDDLGDRAEGF